MLCTHEPIRRAHRAEWGGEATVGAWARGRSLPLRQVQRAQIIQLAATGVESQDIARLVGVSHPTVQLWHERFLALRLVGLEKDAPRPGRVPRIAEHRGRAVVEATLHTKPANATHWSTRTMAVAQGISEATVRRIWHQHNLKPHLTKMFKLSRDKLFVEKLCDVVGLYLNPPDRVLVLCVGREVADPKPEPYAARPPAEEGALRHDDA